MTLIRIGLNSLVLAIADLAGIAGGGVAAFRILGVPNQVWLQLPIAVVVSASCFWGWVLSLRVLGWARLRLTDSKEAWACLAVSLLWAPLVFVPLHYFTQGYSTGIGNLVALALYQVPVNGLALLVALLSRGPGSSRGIESAAAPVSPAKCASESNVESQPPPVR